MTTPLKAIIVDDESLARKGLKLRLEDIDEVDCIHKEDKLMARHQHICKRMPMILKKYRQFSNKLHIHRAAN